jgi:NTE family protein
MGIKPVEIAGSSIGSIIGAGYASGMSGTDIENFLIDTFGNRTQVLAKLWKLRPDPIKAIMGKETNVTAFGQMNIEKVLNVFLPQELPSDFSDLAIPLKITATDFYGNSLKVLQSGDLRKAIAASAAIPVVFTPVIIDKRVLIDGGINNPLPFDLLDNKDVYTIAVDVVGLPMGEDGTIPGRVDVGFGASQLMMQSITNIKLEANPPDLFLRPNVDAFRVLDFLKVKEIIKATQPIYDQTRRGLERLSAL